MSTVRHTLTGSRLVRVLVAAALTGLTAVAAPLPRSAVATVTGPCAEVRTTASGTWSLRAAPAFPTGPREVVSHAVASDEPAHQLVTNGQSVLGTHDGCSWHDRFTLPPQPTPDLPAGRATDRILEVVVHPRAPQRVWAVVAVGQDVAERLSLGLPWTPANDEKRDGTSTLVLRSADGGTTWAAMRTPPLPGAPGRLAPAPSDPDVLYLPTGTGLLASTDGGATWQPRGPSTAGPGPGGRPLDAVAGPLPVEVAVDPASPVVVHGRTTTAVRSTDGGTTWSSYGVPPGHVTGPFLAGWSGDARLLYSRQELSTTPVVDWWRRSDPSAPLARTALAADTLHGVPVRGAWSPRHQDLLLATWDRGNGAAFTEVGLYRVRPDGSAEDVDDLGLPPVLGVLADAGGGFHLHTRHELVTWTPGGEPTAPDQQVDLDPFAAAAPEPPLPATLTAPTELTVPEDGPARLDVGLSLPRRPTPLDTYFLMDTSNSFEPDIDSAAEGMAEVVRRLRAAGVDAHFGVGELGTQEARRYRRLADVAAPGRELQRGFERLRTGGSTESHLIALHQTATGSGVAGGSGPAVPPGLDPTWRAGTLRTVVVVTDVEFSDEDDPEAPQRAEVYRALAERGVRVVGLEIVREGGDDGVPGGYAAVEAADAASTTVPTPARRDLEELARETGSFAPPGGVDCRGNGTVEITEGAPLVCTTTELHLARLSTLADVLARVLLAQVDRRGVTLEASGPVTVEPQTPTGWRQRVDVRRDQELAFAGALACLPGHEGRTVTTELTARLRGKPVARTSVAVRCPGTAVPPPVADEKQVPGTPPAPAPGTSPQVVPPAPPAPPPAPAQLGGTAGATGSAPASAPGSATGGSPATSPGAAAAAGQQEQEQQEAVLVTHSMSRLDQSAQTWPVLAAGGLMAVTAGALLRRDPHRPHIPAPRLLVEHARTRKARP